MNGIKDAVTNFVLQARDPEGTMGPAVADKITGAPFEAKLVPLQNSADSGGPTW